MDDRALIRRIELALRAQPPPPVAVLEQVVDVLVRARGGGAGAAAAGATKESWLTESLPESGGDEAGPAAAALGAAAAEQEGGMSLPLGQPDARWERYKTRHENRAATLKAPADLRAQKTRALQALCEGRGGKYVHCDFVGAGSTQIGSGRSFTPSMTARMSGPNASKTPISDLGSALKLGPPPQKDFGRGDFKF